MFGGSGDSGAAAQEAARQARIRSGMGALDTEFAGFTPEFYAQAGKDYTAYAMPQLMEQYQKTRNDLAYSLARAGLSKSGAAVSQNNSLQKTLALNEGTIANAAADRENQLRSNVSSQKGELVTQLEASSDPASVNEQAVGAVSQLRAPSAMQPLGNMFSDWTQTYLAGKSANGQTGQMSGLSQLLNQGYGTVGNSGNASYLY
jgi:hypothetical protein